MKTKFDPSNKSYLKIIALSVISAVIMFEGFIFLTPRLNPSRTFLKLLDKAATAKDVSKLAVYCSLRRQQENWIPAAESLSYLKMLSQLNFRVVDEKKGYNTAYLSLESTENKLIKKKDAVLKLNVELRRENKEWRVDNEFFPPQENMREISQLMRRFEFYDKSPKAVAPFDVWLRYIGTEEVKDIEDLASLCTPSKRKTTRDLSAFGLEFFQKLSQLNFRLSSEQIGFNTTYLKLRSPEGFVLNVEMRRQAGKWRIQEEMIPNITANKKLTTEIQALLMAHGITPERYRVKTAGNAYCF